MTRITLLTDFGTRDGYVGAMKAVMASLFPGVIIDDISHDVEPGDIAGAALALERYWNRYPRGTVHVAVIDPGVGTTRRALAIEADRRFLVLPDNGIATRVLDSAEQWRAVALEEEVYLGPEASRTFHGRDLFAPSAAYLARGLHLSRLGSSVPDPVRISRTSPSEGSAGKWVGQVISTDRFGNLVTNLPGDRLEGVETVEVGDRRIPVRGTYGEVEPGELLALVNSDQRVEVAARDDSAARILDAAVGTPVRLGIA